MHAAVVLTNMLAFVGRPQVQFVFLNFHLLGNGRKLNLCAERSFLFAGGGTVTWCRDSEVILQVFLQPLTSDLQTPSDWLIKYSAVRRRAGKGCLWDGEEEEGWCWWRPRSEVWLLWWWLELPWEEGGGGGGSRSEGGTADDLMGTIRVSMTSQSTCIIIS